MHCFLFRGQYIFESKICIFDGSCGFAFRVDRPSAVLAHFSAALFLEREVWRRFPTCQNTFFPVLLHGCVRMIVLLNLPIILFNFFPFNASLTVFCAPTASFCHV
jgi:hypothetical protein